MRCPEFLAGNKKGENRGSLKKQTATSLAKSHETVDNLLHNTPRKAAVGNIIAFALVEGLIIGVLMGASVAWGTRHIPDKLWVYVANTGIALFAKVVWAWLWVIWGRTLVIRIATIITQKSNRRVPRTVHGPEGLPDQANRTVLIVTVTMAFATILGTEEFNPRWITEPLHIVWITGLTGVLIAAVESLSVPNNIQALWKNEHLYQENLKRSRRRRR